jgi:hypothetical protein
MEIKKNYRVWHIIIGNEIMAYSDWMTYTDCKKSIIGRSGHWPPWAIISSAKTERGIKRLANMYL